jgi:5-methylcytosine-specific restriction endonuclease McrA
VDLGGRGDRKAWEYLSTLYPGDLQYRRLIGDYVNPNLDAINDIGTDTPERSMSEVSTYPRDRQVREAVLTRANGRCEYCGELGFKKSDGSRYIETHHVIALAREGIDRVTNVIGICANDHREAHYGERSQEIEAEMIKRLAALNAS